MEESQSNILNETPFKLGPLEIAAPMGIGTWSWGDSRIWGYSDSNPNFNKETITEAYDYATQCGLDFWDTAEIYGKGKSEEILGSIIKKFPDRKAVVATKFLPYPWRIFQVLDTSYFR